MEDDYLFQLRLKLDDSLQQCSLGKDNHYLDPAQTHRDAARGLRVPQLLGEVEGPPLSSPAARDFGLAPTIPVHTACDPDHVPAIGLSVDCEEIASHYVPHRPRQSCLDHAPEHPARM